MHQVQQRAEISAWVLEPFVVDGEMRAMVALCDSAGGHAVGITRWEHLDRMAHLAIGVAGRVDEAQLLAADHVDHGLWTPRQRTDWLLHRCSDLTCRFDIPCEGLERHRYR